MSVAAGVATVTGSPVAHLLRPATIRERCRSILAAADAGATQHFRVDRTRLGEASTLVADVTRRRYPDLNIPYHSRWRHFEAGGIDRASALTRALTGRDVATVARARIDLTVVSVLLDAGAGAAWSYREAETGAVLTRSEGLGVASFRAFMEGVFSGDARDPCRVDASALSRIDAAMLARAFQVDTGNPLVGLDGRAALLRRLGAALLLQTGIFGSHARPGVLYDAMLAGDGGSVSAAGLLQTLLHGLGPIWLSGNALDGVALGDCWRHPNSGGTGPTAGWVPFHKLSQWLTYSLFEPFEWAGMTVLDKDALTGLPEYRNGGLLLDTGALTFVDPAATGRTHEVGSELVVEWRALTVALLDELAPLIRAKLDRSDLPLARILEGGTWAAGRELAQHLRGGAPPFAVRSDGTVF
ncbi:MAG: URC4/urg3 family protein [Betaproteobacteria bacterium]